jgi:hypothetical protein
MVRELTEPLERMLLLMEMVVVAGVLLAQMELIPDLQPMFQVAAVHMGVAVLAMTLRLPVVVAQAV